MKKIPLIGLILMVALMQSTPIALAATTSTIKQGAQALEIGPPILELNGNPGQTITTKLDIRDISSGPLIVSNQINDFVAKGDSGVPQILLNNNQNDPYSLKNYINPLPDILLQAQQIKTINVTINIPTDASPGGHYGVIRFTGTPPSLNGSSSGVSLSASLGALVLLTVSGKITENLATSSFYVSSSLNGKPSSFFQNGPLTFNELLKNAGNVHVIPLGTLTLKDMFGHTVVQLNLNSGEGNVLPGSARKFTEQVSKVNIGNKRLFGRYTASYAITYGSSKKTLNDSLTFWVIPLNLITIWLVVLIGCFFLIRWLIKRYNQYILTKARNSHRK